MNTPEKQQLVVEKLEQSLEAAREELARLKAAAAAAAAAEQPQEE